MRCDFFILADAAQVAGDKVSMLGGGWRYLKAQQLPTTHPMALAIGILVEWLETNRRHPFKVEITHEDSKRRVFEVTGEFETGRPPGTPAGAAQRAVMALNFPAKLEAAGPYDCVLRINGRRAAETSFTLIDLSAPPVSAVAPAGAGDD